MIWLIESSEWIFLLIHFTIDKEYALLHSRNRPNLPSQGSSIAKSSPELETVRIYWNYIKKKWFIDNCISKIRWFKSSKRSSFFWKSTWKMGGDFLLFSSMISGIDTSAQRYEHFLYKIHKNHAHLILEHRHLVLEVDNNWGYGLEVLNADWVKNLEYGYKFVYIPNRATDTHMFVSEPTKIWRSFIFFGKSIL